MNGTSPLPQVRAANEARCFSPGGFPAVEGFRCGHRIAGLNYRRVSRAIGVPLSLFCDCRRVGFLRARYHRPISCRRRLHRSHPEGRETETAHGWDLWGGSAFALRLSHKMTVERCNHAKQCFFPGLHSYAARGIGLRTALDALQLPDRVNFPHIGIRRLDAVPDL
jgi:hypothetical protein